MCRFYIPWALCSDMIKVYSYILVWKIAAHSAYDMFSWYKYLIVNLVFSHLGFWSGNLFLIAPFLHDLCLFVPFYEVIHAVAHLDGPFIIILR